MAQLRKTQNVAGWEISPSTNTSKKDATTCRFDKESGKFHEYKMRGFEVHLKKSRNVQFREEICQNSQT